MLQEDKLYPERIRNEDVDKRNKATCQEFAFALCRSQLCIRRSEFENRQWELQWGNATYLVATFKCLPWKPLLTDGVEPRAGALSSRVRLLSRICIQVISTIFPKLAETYLYSTYSHNRGLHPLVQMLCGGVKRDLHSLPIHSKLSRLAGSKRIQRMCQE